MRALHALSVGEHRLSPRSGRPPRTRVRTGPAVPGWALRVAVLLPVLLAGVALSPEGAQWLVLATVGVGLAIRPHGALVALAIAGVGLVLVFAEPSGWWRLPLLVLASHGLLWLAALAEPAAWDTRVELAVLRAALPAFLVVQLVGQAAGALAQLLRGAAPLPWLVVAGLAGLALVTALLTTQLARRRAGARRERF